jgi:hypothetical protein
MMKEGKCCNNYQKYPIERRPKMGRPKMASLNNRATIANSNNNNQPLIMVRSKNIVVIENYQKYPNARKGATVANNK